MSLGAAFGHGSPGVGALQAIFLPCVRIIEPDCAFLGTAQVPARVGQGITAGWLTYVAGASLPGRSLGPPAEIQRLDGLGHMIVAQPEPFQEGVREHVEAVRAVQRALDGEENAAEPSVILVDNDPESRWARWAGVHSTVETGRVDLALMRRIVLPFKEGAAPSPCASAALVTRANDEAQCPFPNGDETMLLLVLAPPEGIPSAQTGALSLANGEAAASAARCT